MTEEHQTPTKRPLPLLTSEYLQDIPGFARRYFRDLCGWLRRPAVIVLDNFQEVPADCILQRLVALAIAEIPPEVNLIVVSRADDGQPLAQGAEETHRAAESDHRGYVKYDFFVIR